MAWLMLGSCVCSAACSVVACLMARPERTWKIMAGRRSTSQYQKDMQKGAQRPAVRCERVTARRRLKSEKVWNV